jgi:predicted transcriptional regulator
MQDRDVLLVSIKPRFAAMLLVGTKTVELRRVRPNVEFGARVLLYASSPRRALVGTASVAAVDEGLPAQIWGKHRGRVGLTDCEFNEYFYGSATAVAITLTDISGLPRGEIALAELQRRRRGFRPPQSFRYLDAASAAALAA